MINSPVMQEELRSGQLVIVGTEIFKPEDSDHLCRRQNARHPQNVKDLFKFLAE